MRSHERYFPTTEEVLGTDPARIRHIPHTLARVATGWLGIRRPQEVWPEAPVSYIPSPGGSAETQQILLQIDQELSAGKSSQ